MNYTNVTIGTPSSSSSVLNAPKKEREVQAASFAKELPRESVLFESSSSHTLNAIQSSFEKVSEFYEAHKESFDSDSIRDLIEEHEEVYAAVANAYHSVENVVTQNTKGDAAISALSAASSSVERYTETIATSLKKEGRPVVSSSHANANVTAQTNIFLVISAAAVNAYQMSVSISELQGEISKSLNNLIGLLKDLQAIAQKIDKAYKDMAAYAAANGGDIDKDTKKPKQMAMPENINWGSKVYNLSWDQMSGSGASNAGFVFSDANSSDQANNSLVKMFGTYFNNKVGNDTSSGYFMTMENVENAIKYVSEMLGGFMPDDQQGSFYAQYGSSPRSSLETGNFFTAIGKTTEMIQSKIAAAANTVNLSQQSAFQVLGLWSQSLTVWGNIQNKS